MHIVIEGPDGAGKSTVVQSIADTLGCNRAAHPGATDFGQEIRALVKNKVDIAMSKYTEQILMAADYYEFIHQILLPALEEGETVLSDRSNLISGMIYGLAGDMTREQVKIAQQIVIAYAAPMMHMIVLTSDYDNLKNRQHHDLKDGKEVECKFENRGDDYKRRVCELYGGLCSGTDTLSQWMQERAALVGAVGLNKVDANQPLEDVVQECLALVRNWTS